MKICNLQKNQGLNIYKPTTVFIYPEFMFSVFISVAGRKMLVVIVVGENVIPEEIAPLT